MEYTSIKYTAYGVKSLAYLFNHMGSICTSTVIHKLTILTREKFLCAQSNTLKKLIASRYRKTLQSLPSALPDFRKNCQNNLCRFKNKIVQKTRNEELSPATSRSQFVHSSNLTRSPSGIRFETVLGEGYRIH